MKQYFFLIVSLTGLISCGQQELDTDLEKKLAAVELSDQGKFAEAEKSFREIIASMERSGAAEERETLLCRCLLAGTLDSMRKFTDAEKEYREVLPIMERVLGKEDRDVFIAYGSLGLCLSNQAKYKDALEFVRRAERGQMKTSSPGDPELKASQGLRVQIEQICAKNEKYVNELRALVTLSEQKLGPDHPDTLNCRNRVADRLDYQRNYLEAEKEFRMLLEVRQRVQGMDHLDTFSCWNELARTLIAQGKFMEAEREYLAMLSEKEKLTDVDDSTVLSTCYELAKCLEKAGKLDEALVFAERVEKGYQKAQGPVQSNADGAQKIRVRIESALIRQKAVSTPKEENQDAR